jgi:hypothetical protein
MAALVPRDHATVKCPPDEISFTRLFNAEIYARHIYPVGPPESCTSGTFPPISPARLSDLDFTSGWRGNRTARGILLFDSLPLCNYPFTAPAVMPRTI